MLLEKILQSIEKERVNGETQIQIDSITYDSSRAKENSLFICIEGFNTDGHKYIENAISKGAIAIVVSKEIDIANEKVTIIKVKNTRKVLAEIANVFYDFPTKKLDLIGVTGTNGKTSTTYMIRNILLQANRKVGLVGTISNWIGSREIDTTRTTPESNDLQYLFCEMLDAGIDSCVMEVSSHSLVLHRVDGSDFKIGIFTNLTRDHLDFHETMENYFNAKKELFYKTSLCNIINADDCHGQRIITEIGELNTPIITYGINNHSTIKAQNIGMTIKDVTFDLVTPKYTVTLNIGTPGLFTVYNTLAACSAAYALDIDKEAIKKGLHSLRSVPGRFEIIKEIEDFTVIVDYAHTPDALENVLNSAIKFKENRIITVMGCGGDRDKTKRPIMGEISGSLSDLTIITSDNPRSEDPKVIIKEIKEGIEKTEGEYLIVEDRKEAIKAALNNAKKRDIVIIVGKGHEKVQIIGKNVYPFDDKKVALEVAREEGLL
ncbi:UDP-N-acetylmuramoyl-L-alanyl-D-glutamate--2,6-diaminopimelate ligase [Serpentinicella alkaliphila]|uniref:UDP-N-acetylmuramoyl-L-alanyl-D-glutamate--2,6-diaminopimelate ligase n=1 Tax=Serpentinicella alkaliphila TaxID=1734049 RepID=A0A4R2U2G7_9FIRM|nr:UDP-N-acetylmuramoyl-L-alanyl-D-glutamate--2,6-diaminopimelate ligase [Serpentinicella alkaliphila]QUH26774.1 UDP-N-acetylmuramoyl-L-alanyl-D-glutamate--2,6-diaminopimelate ligase [Serpentinicella alkaliphila]TCQ07995.1 UDP-N-acetylmuramoylalanyl-D-glutamate--2,6-diaminopimelate ligase [Serpentinicella alkaliphila]